MSRRFSFAATNQLGAYLDELLATGLFGRTMPDVVRGLVQEGIRRHDDFLKWPTKSRNRWSP